MAWHVDPQTKDLVYDGFEKGIATSPHKGVGHLQGVNIATEPGEVMVSFSRTQQSMTTTASTGALTFIDNSHVGLNIAGSNDNFKGSWITVSGTTHAGELANGNYYVLPSTGAGFQLASTYNGAIITGFTSGLSATIALFRTMAQPVAYATESYISSGTTYYRYYVLDTSGQVWVYDTQNDVIYNNPSDAVFWFLPDTTQLSNATGLMVLNGWLIVFAGTTINCKPTVLLGGSSPGWAALAAGQMLSTSTHFGLVGHQSTGYYTDGNLVGSIFPTTSYSAGVPNLYSYASYTAVTTTGTMTKIAGTIPYNGTDNTTRIPVVPFTGGTLPAALSAGTIYYLKWLNSGNTFELYAASSGGAALDIATGSAGTQYFNTFNPTGASAKNSYVFSSAALTLPASETSQVMAEIGDLVVVGTQSNTLYQWNQINAQPTGFIPLPENNSVWMVTVNNMAYVGAGYKGNVYVTNGNTASLVVTVPDYTSGLIEPYFVWGGAAYIRGRIYFSIQDQISGHTGQCGGIWSFIPTQNFFIGQDTGLSLRLENQNSYGTYNGYATVIIPSQTQSARSPQYWAAWVSSISSPVYGIDFTNTTPSQSFPAVIQTDIAETGTMLDKTTFYQIEYKLAAPLVANETVTIAYRQNLSDNFTTLTTSVNQDTSTSLSGYFEVDFEKTQWLQLQATLTPITGSTSSFVRLTELRVR